MLVSNKVVFESRSTMQSPSHTSIQPKGIPVNNSISGGRMLDHNSSTNLKFASKRTLFNNPTAKNSLVQFSI